MFLGHMFLFDYWSYVYFYWIIGHMFIYNIFLFQGLEVKEKGNLARWSLKDNKSYVRTFSLCLKV